MGHQAAAESRYAMGRTIHGWTGAAIVIGNEFNDELKVYGQIGLALHSLEKPVEVYACATQEGWENKVRVAIISMGGSHFLLTGAWHHPENHSGCIDAISAMMDKEHLSWEIMPCAFRL